MNRVAEATAPGAQDSRASLENMTLEKEFLCYTDYREIGFTFV
jgi:hypothetical protein